LKRIERRRTSSENLCTNERRPQSDDGDNEANFTKMQGKKTRHILGAASLRRLSERQQSLLITLSRFTEQWPIILICLTLPCSGMTWTGAQVDESAGKPRASRLADDGSEHIHPQQVIDRTDARAAPVWPQGHRLVKCLLMGSAVACGSNRDLLTGSLRSTVGRTLGP
jgi:hypothetical protein